MLDLDERLRQQYRRDLSRLDEIEAQREEEGEPCFFMAMGELAKLAPNRKPEGADGRTD